MEGICTFIVVWAPAYSVVLFYGSSALVQRRSKREARHVV